jgi:hypothetical protein
MADALEAVAVTGLGFLGGRPRDFFMGMATWDRVLVVAAVVVLGRVLKVAGGVGFDLSRVLKVVGGFGVAFAFVLDVAGWTTLSRRTSLLIRLNAGDEARCETVAVLVSFRGGTDHNQYHRCMCRS